MLDSLAPVLWDLFSIFLTVFGPIAIASLGLLARKYLKGKARLIALTVERDAEAHLQILLRQAIDYAEEQVRFAKNTPSTSPPNKFTTAINAALILLKNSSLPDIGSDRLETLIRQELGTMRRERVR